MNKDLNLKFQKVIEICTESFMQQWHIDLIKSAKVALGELENNVIAFEYDDGNYIVGIVCGNKIARYNVFNRFTKRTVLGDMTSDQTEIKNLSTIWMRKKLLEVLKCHLFVHCLHYK